MEQSQVSSKSDSPNHNTISGTLRIASELNVAENGKQLMRLAGAIATAPARALPRFALTPVEKQALANMVNVDDEDDLDTVFEYVEGLIDARLSGVEDAKPSPTTPTTMPKLERITARCNEFSPDTLAWLTEQAARTEAHKAPFLADFHAKADGEVLP